MKLKHIWEKIIGLAQTSANVDIILPIDLTKHGAERKDREEGQVSNSEILHTAQKSLPNIVQAINTNKIKLNDTIVITDQDSNLNIVGVLIKGEKYDSHKLILDKKYSFKIITIIKKLNFIAKSSDYIVKV